MASWLTVSIAGFTTFIRQGTRDSSVLLNFPWGSLGTPGPPQRPVLWIPWTLTPGVVRPDREADYFPPSNVEF